MLRRSRIVVPLLLVLIAACDITEPSPADFEGRIVFTARPPMATDDQVYLIDGRTKAVIQVTFTQGHKEEPEISPDGLRVAFAWRYPILGKDIYIVDLDGKRTVRVTQGQTDAPPSEPSWSPDGSQLVFSEFAGGIDAISVSGNSLRRISFFGYGPDWSPDGTTIAYATEQGLLRHVRSTGAVVRTTALDGIAINSPRWSPDGNWLVFSGSRGPNEANIYVVREDGTDLRQLTKFPAGSLAQFPNWSPDSRQIAFAGPEGLWFVNADGSRVQLIHSQEGLASPSWHPSPQ